MGDGLSLVNGIIVLCRVTGGLHVERDFVIIQFLKVVAKTALVIIKNVKIVTPLAVEVSKSSKASKPVYDLIIFL